MSESATLSTLSAQIREKNGGVRIILNIHDNSLFSCANADVFSKLSDSYEIQYVHTPENNTLREIYNNAIENLNQEDILLLLDDDTTLPTNYISSLLCDANVYKNVMVFSPKVIVNEKIYSPYKTYSFFSRPLNDISPGKIRSRRHAFINSGLAIRGKFFISSNFRYPEQVDFYGTDTVFSHFFNSHEKTYVLMNLTIFHDVNNHPENKCAKSYANALSKVIRFWLGYLHGISKVMYILYITFYMLKMTVKFRNMIFIKTLMDLK